MFYGVLGLIIVKADLPMFCVSYISFASMILHNYKVCELDNKMAQQ